MTKTRFVWHYRICRRPTRRRRLAELPEAGDTVTAGEVCGELESTKSVSELYSPVTGTVVEVNEDVIQNPERINEEPYGAGWLFTVDVTEEGELLTPSNTLNKPEPL